MKRKSGSGWEWYWQRLAEQHERPNARKKRKRSLTIYEILGCTWREMTASNVDMDTFDDARWLKNNGIDLKDRKAVESALRGLRGEQFHALGFDNARYVAAVMSWEIDLAAFNS
jgi:hypothetical protein